MVDCWENLDLTVETLRKRNAFKFVFKAYVGVIAPPILTAMDRVEPMTDPVQISSLPEVDKNIARSRSCWRKSCLDHLYSS